MLCSVFLGQTFPHRRNLQKNYWVSISEFCMKSIQPIHVYLTGKQIPYNHACTTSTVCLITM